MKYQILPWPFYKVQGCIQEGVANESIYLTQVSAPCQKLILDIQIFLENLITLFLAIDFITSYQSYSSLKYFIFKIRILLR